MTGRQLLSALGEIDEVYIEEAAPTGKSAKKVNYKVLKWCALAAVVLLAVGVGSIWGLVMNAEKKMDGCVNMDSLENSVGAEGTPDGSVSRISLEVTLVHKNGFEASVIDEVSGEILRSGVVVEFCKDTIIVGNEEFKYDSNEPNGESSGIKVGDLVEVKYEKSSDEHIIVALEIRVK